MQALAQPICLTLYGLEQFLLQCVVVRVKWDGHSLTTSGCYWQGLQIATDHIN